MPPPTMQEVMNIPTQAGNFNKSAQSLADYFAQQAQEKQAYARQLAMYQAQQQMQMQQQQAMAQYNQQLQQQSPLWQAQLQGAQQGIGQNGQPPQNMQWEIEKQRQVNQIEQERAIAVDRAKQQEELKMKQQDPAYIQDLKFQQQYGPMLQGGQQQSASQMNFNPIMRGQGQEMLVNPQAQGGANFNPMNPMSQGGQRQSDWPAGHRPNPNKIPGDGKDRWIKDESVQDRKAKNQELTSTTRIRQEFINRPEVKDYVEVKTQLSAMEKAYKSWKGGNTKSANAIDQVLINTFGRMIDPGATVRESEYARTPQGMSMVNRFDTAWQKLSKGGTLNNPEREALVQAAQVVANERGKTYNDTLTEYEGLAADYDLDSSLISRGMKRHEDFGISEQAGGQSSGYVRTGTLPDGRRVGVKQDGTSEIIGGQ